MVEESLVERDMSLKLGKFNAFQLVYFTNLQVIDISGMNFVIAQDFVDCVQACELLKEIYVSRCRQFHEFQIVRMLCALIKLEKVDVTSTSLMQYVNVFVVVTSLRRLRLMKCDPKYPQYQCKKWKWLISNFQRAEFGKSIMKILEHK